MEYGGGAGTLVEAALRVKPADMPVVPNLLLAASAADSRGLKLLTEVRALSILESTVYMG